jgi:hypothetical protein
MVEETRRPLTAQERSILESLSRPASSGGAPFAAFLTFMVTLGLLLIVLPDSWQLGFRSLAPAGVALVFAVVVYLRARRQLRGNVWYQRIARDLQGGAAAVTTYHVTDAISVEEFEDEGSQYYLLLKDGRVLFLAGQYLYEPEEEKRFPSTLVSVVRAPESGTVLDLTTSGESVPVSARLEPFSPADHREGRVPEDGTLVDLDFDAVRSRRFG